MSTPVRYRLSRSLPLRPEGPVREAVSEAEGERVVLWPGPPPGPRPSHPALPAVLGHGLLEGAAVWVEARPAGALLVDLEPGLPVGPALAEVAQGLAVLHAAGGAHGDLDAAAVVVDAAGRGHLLGARGRGSAAADEAALAALVEAWARTGPPGSPGAEGAAGWEGAEGAARLAARVALVEARTRAEGRWLEVALGGQGSVDEVGFDLGRDESARGLLDTWAGRTLPGVERTGSAEPTGSWEPEEMPLTAVLAQVAAGLGREAAADRFAAWEGTPSRAVKALIADEPLDPLPVPDGLPLSGTSFLEPGGSADVTAVAGLPVLGEGALPGSLEPQPAEPLAAAPPAVEPGAAPAAEREVSATLLLVAVTLALAAGAAGAWLVLVGW